MKLEIDYKAAQELVELKFHCNQLTNKRDINVALSILQTFSADYDMDPEISPEDLQGFLKKADTDNKDTLIFEISEDGIELELIDSLAK